MGKIISKEAVINNAIRPAAGALLLAGLYLSSRYNYLLFHSLAEFFSIAIAYAAFMFAWNSRSFTTNRLFPFIGIAYLFIGSLDMLHALSYKGMSVFEGHGADLPTQLWIAARYMESISLLAGVLLMGRSIRGELLLGAYAGITALLLISIFHLDIFPTCYVEGLGLTPFKTFSEYIISGILVAALVALRRRHASFDSAVLKLLSASIILTMVSELSFTLYVDVYGIFNLIGHYLKILSFYLIYLALIQTGLKKPYSLLFKELKWHADRLISQRDRAREYLDIAGAIILVIDPQQRVELINRKGCEVLGYREEEITGSNWFDKFLPERVRMDVKKVFEDLINGDIEPAEFYENPVLTRDGQERIIAWHNTVLRDEEGRITCTLASGEDITERKRAERELERSKALLESTINGMDEVILIVDSYTRTIEKANRALERTWGYLPEEVVGHNTEFMHTDRESYERFGTLMRNALLSQGVLNTEYAYKRKDGSTFTAEVSVTLVHEGSEHGPKLVGVFRDITERKRAEESLKETTRQYRDLVEATEAIHWELDLETRRFTYVGPQAENVLDYSVKEWKDYYFWASIIHPEDRGWAMEYCEQATSRSEDHEFTYRALDRDGRVVWLRDVVNVVSDESGPRKLLGIMFDVTDQKQKEMALSRANEMNRAILDNMLEPICIINVRDFTIEAVNRAFLDEYGLSEREARGRTCHEVTHRIPSPCSGPKDVCPLHEALSHGIHCMVEHVHYRADGSEATVEVWVLPIKDDEGVISHAVHVSRDITERKRTEERIRNHSRFLQTLIDTMPNAVFYKDVEGRYVGCNKAFEKFLNLPANEILGRTVYDIAPRELADRYREKDDALFRKPGVQVYEVAVIGHDGQKRDVIFNKATYNKSDGSLGGLVGVVVDITERKELEDSLRQSIKDKEMLMREMNHRVKNNLNVIQSLLSLQSHEIEDETTRGKFDESKSRIRAMSMIHERLYRSEDLKNIELGEYLRSLAVSISRNYQVNAPGVTLVTEIDDMAFDVDRMIPCGLILNELLSNAYKYAFPEGGEGKIHVRLKCTDSNCELSVRDNGVGLPEDLDMENTTSLGMQIVNSLISQIGGTLHVSRKEGTEFRITFSEDVP